jgi:hypothetical protein
MIMKKLFVLLAVTLGSLTMASAQDWSAGVRLGSGFQAVGQKYFMNDDYVEGRFGMNWLYKGGMAVDVSALYVWNIANMNWTDEGNWFFDLGAGANVGAASHYFYLGVQGMAKLGYEFEGAPVRLAIDWSPSFGPGIASFAGHSNSELNTTGMGSFGLSAVYMF